MSVLFKALQRAEKARDGDRRETEPSAEVTAPTDGMPAVGAGRPDGASLRGRIAEAARNAARRPDPAVAAAPLSMGRRIARLLGIMVILSLASLGAALYLYGDDVEMILAEVMGEPAPRPAQPQPVPVPVPEQPAAPPSPAEPQVVVAMPEPTAADPAPQDASPPATATTNIAALMEAGRRARGDTGGTTGNTTEPVPTAETAERASAQLEADAAMAEADVAVATPRSLTDVLDAEARSRAAAGLKPPVAVERPEAARAGAPDADVRVDLQTAQERNAVATAYRALMRGDYHAALATYDIALESDTPSLAALLGRAAALHKLRRLDEAQAAYERVLGIEPTNREALTNLADILALAAPQEALARLQDLHARAPDFGPVAAQIGLLNARMGRPDQAIRYMARAAALEPGNALYRYNLAILQDRSGDRPAAAESYRRVLDAINAGASVGVPATALRDRLRYLTSPQR